MKGQGWLSFCSQKEFITGEQKMIFVLVALYGIVVGRGSPSCLRSFYAGCQAPIWFLLLLIPFCAFIDYAFYSLLFQWFKHKVTT
jgi:hypothetical protein